MTTIDFVLLGGIGVLFLLACCFMKKKKHHGCCGSCEGCNHSCNKK